MPPRFDQRPVVDRPCSKTAGAGAVYQPRTTYSEVMGVQEGNHTLRLGMHIDSPFGQTGWEGGGWIEARPTNPRAMGRPESG